ncbi:MAG: hypothetical protein ACLQIQ_18840 [Beijerinckiaceae bacterium]
MTEVKDLPSAAGALLFPHRSRHRPAGPFEVRIETLMAIEDNGGLVISPGFAHPRCFHFNRADFEQADFAAGKNDLSMRLKSGFHFSGDLDAARHPNFPRAIRRAF